MDESIVPDSFHLILVLTFALIVGFASLTLDLMCDSFGATSVFQWHRVYKLLTISADLYQAAKDLRYKECHDLLSKDPDVNIQDKDGRSPLYFICKDGHEELAKSILDHEADGVGCLEVAIEFYNIDVAVLLLENGVDPNRVRNVFSF